MWMVTQCGRTRNLDSIECRNIYLELAFSSIPQYLSRSTLEATESLAKKNSKWYLIQWLQSPRRYNLMRNAAHAKSLAIKTRLQCGNSTEDKQKKRGCWCKKTMARPCSLIGPVSYTEIKEIRSSEIQNRGVSLNRRRNSLQEISTQCTEFWTYERQKGEYQNDHVGAVTSTLLSLRSRENWGSGSR